MMRFLELPTELLSVIAEEAVLTLPTGDLFRASLVCSEFIPSISLVFRKHAYKWLARFIASFISYDHDADSSRRTPCRASPCYVVTDYLLLKAGDRSSANKCPEDILLKLLKHHSLKQARQSHSRFAAIKRSADFLLSRGKFKTWIECLNELCDCMVQHLSHDVLNLARAKHSNHRKYVTIQASHPVNASASIQDFRLGQIYAMQVEKERMIC